MALTVDAVLHRVASGELTPEEALVLLDGAQPSTSSPEPAGAPSADSAASADTADTTREPGTGAADDDAPVWGTPRPSGATGTTAGPGTGTTAGSTTGRPVVVRINASYRSVDVLADPGVAEATVSGQHSARREGGALVIESQDTPFGGGSGEPGEGGQRFTFADLPRGLAWARSWKEHHLVVRVNPEIPVELDAAGASVRLSGLEAGAKVRLIASSLKLERVRGPLDVDALSSSVKGFAAPTGSSRVVCESSSVKVILGRGTDTHITARNRMGKVVLPNAISKGGLVDPDVAQATIGPGNGELTIDAVMSSVVLVGGDAGAA